MQGQGLVLPIQFFLFLFLLCGTEFQGDFKLLLKYYNVVDALT